VYLQQDVLFFDEPGIVNVVLGSTQIYCEAFHL